MIYIYHKSCLKMGKVGLLGFLVDDLVDNLFGYFWFVVLGFCSLVDC